MTSGWVQVASADQVPITKALARHVAQFGLGDVQPTPVPWRVNELEWEPSLVRGKLLAPEVLELDLIPTPLLLVLSAAVLVIVLEKEV